MQSQFLVMFHCCADGFIRIGESGDSLQEKDVQTCFTLVTRITKMNFVFEVVMDVPK